MTEPNSTMKNQIGLRPFIVSPEDRVLITGAAGFIGQRVVLSLMGQGFYNLACFTRPSSDLEGFEAIVKRGRTGSSPVIFTGNLLSREDCKSATKGAAVILHLAAGTGERSFPDAYMNSVVATRNLLEASMRHNCLKRFVLVSSFAVYSNCKKPHGRLLDESCPVEEHPELRGDAYSFAKVRQEQLLTEYGVKFGVPYVIVRPGSVYGGKSGSITGRVGLGTFGVYLHLGGSNKIPFTYVDNCADAIVLAGLVQGVEGEVFNVVDDDLPSSRQFLRMYKKNVRRFKSIYVPHLVSHMLCYLWERYVEWSKGQLPLAFSRKRWHSEWKKTRYSNTKLKAKLGWNPRISTADGMRRFFDDCRQASQHA